MAIGIFLYIFWGFQYSKKLSFEKTKAYEHQKWPTVTTISCLFSSNSKLLGCFVSKCLRCHLMPGVGKTAMAISKVKIRTIVYMIKNQKKTMEKHAKLTVGDGETLHEVENDI